jgi:two-component system nitrogen regulation response regulator NtrX
MLPKPDSATRRSAIVKGKGASQRELVLIVDDDEDLRTAVRGVLENAGYPTAEANDGQEALAFMQQAQDKPALLLLDLMMPSMDGWQLRGRLRTDPVLAAIPIVIMTAHAGVLRAVSNARPETPVLSKPLDVVRLLQVVATYCH